MTNSRIRSDREGAPSSPGAIFAWRTLNGHRAFLMKAGLCGAALAAVVALLIPNQYRSSVELMPPEQQAVTTVSALTPLSGQLPAIGGGGLLNTKTPGAISVGILGSRTVQDDIINRFDLRRVYYRKTYESTRRRLATNTYIEENRKNGIIEIDVTDKDPYRARDIGRAYVEDLNRLLNRLSTSSARRERQFLEDRLASVKRSMDIDVQVLSQFSSRNATLDYQKQGQATLEVAGKLEEELIATQSDLSGLKAVYTDDNVQVRTLTARMSQLRAQLHKITGQDDRSGTTALTNGEMFPSIRQLPLLGATYADLMRHVTSDETLYAALQKQFELARVQEAKEIPAVKVLDEPELAERKSYPPRAGIVIGGGLVGLLAGSCWVVLGSLRKERNEEPHRSESAVVADVGYGNSSEPAVATFSR